MPITPSLPTDGQTPWGDQLRTQFTKLAAATNAMSGDTLWARGQGETFSRLNNVSAGAGTGNTWITHFTALSDLTVTNLGVLTAGTGSTSPTLCRLALYAQQPDYSLTKVAQTANDTTIAAGAYSRYTRALSTAGGFPASYDLVCGQRYALGFLQVASSACTLIVANVANTASPPRVSCRIGGQSDLSATYSNSTLDSSSHYEASYFFVTG